MFRKLLFIVSTIMTFSLWGIQQASADTTTVTGWVSNIYVTSNHVDIKSTTNGQTVNVGVSQQQLNKFQDQQRATDIGLYDFNYDKNTGRLINYSRNKHAEFEYYNKPMIQFLLRFLAVVVLLSVILVIVNHVSTKFITKKTGKNNV